MMKNINFLKLISLMLILLITQISFSGCSGGDVDTVWIKTRVEVDTGNDGTINTVITNTWEELSK
jgi:hypothetical protein